MNAEQLGRFLPKFKEGNVWKDGTRCWLWKASVTVNGGYGQFYLGTQNGAPKRPTPAHRVSYEHWIGPIPEGLQLDHLCREPRCVNPLHLEPVTNAENGRRGIKGVLTTHCPQGHPYDAKNTLWRRRTTTGALCRVCRACANQKVRERKERDPERVREQHRRANAKYKAKKKAELVA